MHLDDCMLRLIAVGASVAANCHPCLRANVDKALQAGAGQREIARAISIGRVVRQGASSDMDRFIASLASGSALETGKALDEGCGCAASPRLADEREESNGKV